jgi:chitinase
LKGDSQPVASSDGAKWTKFTIVKSGSPNDTTQPEIQITGAPASVVFNGKLYVFFTSSKPNETGLWVTYITYDGAAWSEKQYLNSKVDTYWPTVGTLAGKLFVFHKGEGTDKKLYCASYDGKTWSKAKEVPDSNAIRSASVETSLGGLQIYYNYNDSRIGFRTHADLSCDHGEWTKRELVPLDHIKGDPAVLK